MEEMKKFALISEKENPFFKPRESAICKYLCNSVIAYVMLATLASYRKMSKYGTSCPEFPPHGANHVNQLISEDTFGDDEGNLIPNGTYEPRFILYIWKIS